MPGGRTRGAMCLYQGYPRMSHRGSLVMYMYSVDQDAVQSRWARCMLVQAPCPTTVDVLVMRVCGHHDDPHISDICLMSCTFASDAVHACTPLHQN